MLGKPYRNACIAAVIQMSQKMRIAAHKTVKPDYCKPPESGSIVVSDWSYGVIKYCLQCYATPAKGSWLHTDTLSGCTNTDCDKMQKVSS